MNRFAAIRETDISEGPSAETEILKHYNENHVKWLDLVDKIYLWLL